MSPCMSPCAHCETLVENHEGLALCGACKQQALREFAEDPFSALPLTPEGPESPLQVN